VATLRLFAQAREAAGARSVEIDAATVGGVIDEARGRFGEAFGAVVDSSKIWLNGAPAHPSDEVDAGDEVAVLPPVSGG
jgi:molybdopterin synthase sulfur carrier subunit